MIEVWFVPKKIQERKRVKIKNLSLKNHNQISRQKIHEAKKNLCLVASDYDGTLKDSETEHVTVKSLIDKLLNKYHVAILSARGVSAKKFIFPLYLNPNISFNHRLFFAGANGLFLDEITNISIKSIYRNDLKKTQIEKIILVYKNIVSDLKIKNKDLNQEGIRNFKIFLQEDWDGLVEKYQLNVSNKLRGKIFVEPAKISIVLPSAMSKKNKFINTLRKKLGRNFLIIKGDEIYAHISLNFKTDGKLMALKKIMKILKLKKSQVASFGDMPLDNDRGLLSLPFSFTNNISWVREIDKSNVGPFLIWQPGVSEVKSVHKTLSDLI